MTNPEQARLDLKPGDVLAGKYRVERVLGAGGMGIVVAAHHLQLDEKVALKFLLPEAVVSADAVARFLQEARAAAKVKSEHVARVIDVGQLEGGSPYMVMEYLEGSDLAVWLQQRGPLPVEQAVDFVLQACEALAHAHSLGIVHRDLKPSNLFCTTRSDGRLCVKVLDFGISKITTPGAAGHDMTSTRTAMGSPLYMSPEQMKLTKGVDARTDIWSLGVILFELVSGRPPFDAEAVTELAIKVATEPPAPLRQLRPDAPLALEMVIERCLEKDRTKRFQSVGELAVALRELAPTQGRVSVDRVLGTLRNAVITGDVTLPPSTELEAEAASAPTLLDTSRKTGAAWGQTAGGSRSAARSVVWVAIAGVLGVLALVAAFVMRKPEPSARSTATAAPSSPPAMQSAAAEVVPVASATPYVAPAVTVATASPSTPTAPAVPAKPSARPSPGSRSSGRSAPPPAPATPPPASPSSAPKPNCNPPYVIDSAGDRQYKPECL